MVADPRDPNLRRVRIGRRTVAVLAATTAAELGVREEVPWDSALAAAVAERAALDAARRDALKALARASMPSSRLRQSLARRGHSEAIVQRVVADLVGDGWLDDRQMAELAAAAIQRQGRLPRRTVRQTLVARGVDEALAASAANAGAAPGQEEREACTTLAARLLAREEARVGEPHRRRSAARSPGGSRGPSLEKPLGEGRRSGHVQPPGRSLDARAARRIAAALARRGFDSDIIASSMDALGIRLTDLEP